VVGTLVVVGGVGGTLEDERPHEAVQALLGRAMRKLGAPVLRLQRLVVDKGFACQLPWGQIGCSSVLAGMQNRTLGPNLAATHRKRRAQRAPLAYLLGPSSHGGTLSVCQVP
jgi:hypothetical protein